MSATDPRAVVEAVYTSHRERLLRLASWSYPGLDRGRLEDAVSDAMEVALKKPHLVLSAYHHGEGNLIGLFARIVRRQARQQVRRHDYARAASDQDCPDRQELPAQEFLACVSLGLDDQLDRSVDDTSATHADALRAALIDALLSGDSEIDVAQRNGIRREYLNRARRELEHRMWTQIIPQHGAAAPV